jgi:hypothetical protein
MLHVVEIRQIELGHISANKIVKLDAGIIDNFVLTFWWFLSTWDLVRRLYQIGQKLHLWAGPWNSDTKNNCLSGMSFNYKDSESQSVRFRWSKNNLISAMQKNHKKFSIEKKIGMGSTNSLPYRYWTKALVQIRVVDPDPDWIRIQWLCGSGSILGIRIPDPDPGARKLRNFSGKWT